MIIFSQDEKMKIVAIEDNEEIFTFSSKRKYNRAQDTNHVTFSMMETWKKWTAPSLTSMVKIFTFYVFLRIKLHDENPGSQKNSFFSLFKIEKHFH